MAMLKVFVDADLSNADWTKQSWDLPDDPAEAARILTAGHDTVAAIRRLPVVVWNPDRAGQVLAECEQILAARKPDDTPQGYEG